MDNEVKELRVAVTEEETYVPDTSVIIEGAVSKLIEKGKIIIEEE